MVNQANERAVSADSPVSGTPTELHTKSNFEFAMQPGKEL